MMERLLIALGAALIGAAIPTLWFMHGVCY